MIKYSIEYFQQFQYLNTQILDIQRSIRILKFFKTNHTGQNCQIDLAVQFQIASDRNRLEQSIISMKKKN